MARDPVRAQAGNDRVRVALAPARRRYPANSAVGSASIAGPSRRARPMCSDPSGASTPAASTRQRPGCGGQRLDARPAVGFRPECRRSPGRVIIRAAPRPRAAATRGMRGQISAARLAPAMPAPTIMMSYRVMRKATARHANRKEAVDRRGSRGSRTGSASRRISCAESAPNANHRRNRAAAPRSPSAERRAHQLDRPSATSISVGTSIVGNRESPASVRVETKAACSQVQLGGPSTRSGSRPRATTVHRHSDRRRASAAPVGSIGRPVSRSLSTPRGPDARSAASHRPAVRPTARRSGCAAPASARPAPPHRAPLDARTIARNVR